MWFVYVCAWVWTQGPVCDGLCLPRAGSAEAEAGSAGMRLGVSRSGCCAGEWWWWRGGLEESCECEYQCMCLSALGVKLFWILQPSG